MPLTIRKCLGCGAPLKGLQCPYCDSVHEDPDDQPVESNYYADNAVYVNSFNMNVSLTEEQKAITRALIRASQESND